LWPYRKARKKEALASTVRGTGRYQKNKAAEETTRAKLQKHPKMRAGAEKPFKAQRRRKTPLEKDEEIRRNCPKYSLEGAKERRL